MRLPALVVVCLLAACRKPEAAETELRSAKAEIAPIQVATATVVERPMPEHLVLTGTLRASQESEVAANAAGRVTATFVERGQPVKAGDMLAILDARSAAITATAANAQTHLAQAQLEQAQRECERVKSLKASGAISQAEYDRVTSQCATTQWSAAAAAAQQQSAQKTVGDAVIRAPFSGVVGERYVNVGQYVQADKRVVSLYAPDPLRLELTVPEANIGGLAAEQEVVFTVSAYADEKFTGHVKFISPNVRPSTRDLVIEALCPNPEGKLRPGMFAVARLETATKPQLAVPSAAIVRQAAQAEVSKVFVVADKRLVERIVQTGAEKDGMTAVLVGVKAGEVVAVSPGEGARDGAPVR